MQHKKLSELKPHASNVEIYGQEEVVAGFLEDIRANGVRVPLSVKPDGTIISGHRRWYAAAKCGHDTVPVMQIQFDDELAELESLISFNRQRDKTASQTRREAETLIEIESKKAAIRMRAGISPMQNSAQGSTREIVAAAVGMSHDSLSKLLRLPAEAVARIDSGETTLHSENKRLIHAEITANNNLLRNMAAQAATGKYQVIVIDPPWEMQRIETDADPNATAFDYPTMSYEEIALMPLPAFEDCHLFCWTTQKHLFAAAEIIKRWGFRYVFLMTWHKNGGMKAFGMPVYNSEFILYCRKGVPKFTHEDKFFACFSANRRAHSQKPDEFYDMITHVTEGQTRIDMFSREKREGWAQFGNEVDKF